MASNPPSTPFPPFHHAQHLQQHAHSQHVPQPAHYQQPAPPFSSPSAFASAPRVASVSPPASFLPVHASVLAATQATMQGTVDNPLIPKKRRRTTPAELAILEHEFKNNMRPDPLERARIAERLGMTARAVQVWYQNRRQKEKKESSCSSSIASSGSDPRDLDGVILSFSSSPLPSPALSLHASATGAPVPMGVLPTSQELFAASPTSSHASSSTGSNKENSYFPPMPTSSATMPASTRGRVTAPALLAASAAPATAPAVPQPYVYSYPSSASGGVPHGAVMDTGFNADGTPSVYIHRPHNASIIAAKKHVRKRPQGSHAPLARVPSLPHAFVFPPSPPKPAAVAAAAAPKTGTRTAMARMASLNDVAARQQKKAAATAGLFAHAQGETVAAAAQRRRSSTPSLPSPVTAVAPASSTATFGSDELAPFSQSQPSSLATLTPASKAKAKDELLRHMESDPPSASSPAPLTRRRMMAHEASLNEVDGENEDEEDDQLATEEDQPTLLSAAGRPMRPAASRSLSSSFPNSSSFSAPSTVPRAPTMGRTASLGSFPSHSRTSTSSASASLGAVPGNNDDAVFDPSSSARAGAGRSCAIEALGRKRARILENQAAQPPAAAAAVPAPAPAAVRASSRPSTSAYATQAKALGLTSGRGLGLTLDLAAGRRASEPALGGGGAAARKRRRVSAESAVSSAATDEDDGLAELSFSSTSTASTADSLVTVADSPSMGYFALGAAAKRAADAGMGKTQEDEQRECAELLLGLGGFC
ncbi:hypothetical protein JCM10450v2_002070 [Rhodotorula kratochvilovae]